MHKSRDRLTDEMKDLVLIGGGHTHAIVLRLFGMQPLPGVRLTLITDTYYAPYSGMLPGHIAGFYTFEQCHINLHHLAQFAEARLILDRAIGLDLQHNQVQCTHHPAVMFDWLSIDIGSTPAKSTIPGVAEHTIPAKPVPEFLKQWEQFLQHLQRDWTLQPNRVVRLGIVGGGTAGVELSLTTQTRWQRLFQARRFENLTSEIHLFHRNTKLMTGYHPSVGRRFHQILTRRGIHLHLGETVCAVKAIPHSDENVDQASQQLVRCKSGLSVACDRILWVTHAAAPSWLKEAGLTTDERGFILVDDRLRSLSHPHIFATGDIATMVNHPRPKAGVFAVRQGKPLFENLRRVVLQQQLKPFYPQQRYLALVGTGDGRAVAAWGGLCVGPSSLLWYGKDWIDRRFMEQFAKLPRRPSEILHHFS